MYEGLSDQSIALKNGIGDIAAMAKSSFVHTPKNKRYNLECRLWYTANKI